MRQRPLRQFSVVELAHSIRYAAIGAAIMAIGMLLWVVLIGPALLLLMHPR